MPEYVYKCKKCDQQQTVIRTITEKETNPICATCDEPMTRQFGVAAVKFKGAGFYSNERK